MELRTVLCPADDNLTGMIDLERVTPIRIEQLPIPNRNCKATVYILKCSEPNCNNEIRIYKGKQRAPKGKCRSCSSKKKPFWYIFNSLRLTSKSKKIPMSLTYEEFLQFTNVKNCTYCRAEIQWTEWSYKGYSAKYNLDRKDSNLGYSADNCVVCCTNCNYTKGARFNHEEFMLLAPGLQRINEIRLLAQTGACSSHRRTCRQ